MAREHIDAALRALDTLPETTDKELLATVAEYVVRREA